MRKSVFVVIPLLAVSALLAACGSTAGSSDPAALQGNTYTTSTVTVDGQEKDLAQGSTLSVTFTDGSISLNAGCNTMTGTVDLADGKVAAGELAATRMACPEELMAQDQQLADFIASGPRWSLSGDSLMMSNDTMMLMLEPSVAP